MGVEVLDSGLDSVSDGAKAISSPIELDARRRVEDKIEEIRLRREVQEFDFDF